jgi:acyl carrier protein
MTWPILVAVIVGIALFAWFDPDECARREYNKLMASRDPVSDSELLKYFNPVEMSSDVPGTIREMFARHMDYPAEKMLPDDDLNFYWNEIDMIDIVREIEEHFGITIYDKDAEKTRPTIRSVSELVNSKCAIARKS